MITRYTTSLGTAAGVTFGLLLLMQMLIATGKSSLDPSVSVTPGPVLFEPPKDTPTARDEVIEPPKPVELPPAHPTPTTVNPKSWSVGPRFQPPTKITRPIFPAMLSGAATLIVAPAVIFPSRMLSRGIEGYVIVRFTVTTEGAVRDVVVLESSHKGFEKAAINAALQMKYKPKVVDGTPQPTHNVMYQFTFNIENEV